MTDHAQLPLGSAHTKAHKFGAAGVGGPEAMNRLQRSFYNKSFKPRFLAGDPIDVDGQDGYGLVMLHELLAELDANAATGKAGLELLERAYPRSAAARKAGDCLRDIALLNGHWAEALRRADSRVSLGLILGMAQELDHPRVKPLDLFMWDLGRGSTKTGIKELGGLIDMLGRDLDAFHDAHGISIVEDFWNRLSTGGPVVDIVASIRGDVGPDLNDEDIAWFVGNARANGLYYEPRAFDSYEHLVRQIPVPRPWPRPWAFGLVWRGFLKALVRAAENHVRTGLGLPLVGVGRIGEVRLLNELRAAFPEEDIWHQVRPIWLTPQSLDMVFAGRDIAVEYQGVQHSRPVEYFGGKPAFEAQQQRDANKKWLCEANGMRLLEVHPDYVLDDVLRELQALIDQRGTARPSARRETEW